MTATGPRERVARRCGSVQAWSPPMRSGTTPASTIGATASSIGCVAALRVARDDRDVAVVDAGQDLERRDVQVRVVRPEHDARRADGVRAEAAADPVGDAGVERDADDRDVDVLERPHVRQPGEGRGAGEARALQRVLGDVARHAASLGGAGAAKVSGCRRQSPRPRRPSPSVRPPRGASTG